MMEVKIGGFVTFISAIVLLIKVLDWYLSNEQKNILHSYIYKILQNDSITAAAIAKAPLAAYSKTLDLALGPNVFSGYSLKRSAKLAIIILIASASLAGLMTDTYLGVSSTPWQAYDQEISRLELILQAEKLNENPGLDYISNEETEDYYSRLEDFLLKAKKPEWKAVYISVLLLTSFIVTIGMTTLSLAFSRTVIKELLKTDSLLLIISALTLATMISISIFVITILILFTLTSVFLIFAPSLASVMFFQPTIIGAGVTIGYLLVVWFASPIWIKAISVGAVVPGIILIVTTSVSIAIYPFRHKLGIAIHDLVGRALKSKNGLLAFTATGITLLTAAIMLAASLFVS